jgi:hypothetical protein
MKLFEMFDKAPQGYQDTSTDNSKPKWKQSRNTKLTLKQLRKLRKMLDVRNYERANNLKKIRKQYTPVNPDAMGGMPTL